MGNTPLAIIQQQSTSIHRRASKKPPIATKRAAAGKILEDGAELAAQALVQIATSSTAQDKDVIAASRDILDRVAVGKHRETNSRATIDLQHLTMALAGIAALAGRDMSHLGDMTDLQEKLQTIKINTDDISDIESDEEEPDEETNDE